MSEKVWTPEELRKEGMCLRCAGTGEEPGSVRDPDYGINKCTACGGTGEADEPVSGPGSEHGDRDASGDARP
jgi:DnaJ-class molecular chaperone